jgi:hypothetical protein
VTPFHPSFYRPVLASFLLSFGSSFALYYHRHHLPPSTQSPTFIHPTTNTTSYCHYLPTIYHTIAVIWHHHHLPPPPPLTTTINYHRQWVIARKKLEAAGVEGCV